MAYLVKHHLVDKGIGVAAAQAVDQRYFAAVLHGAQHACGNPEEGVQIIDGVGYPEMRVGVHKNVADQRDEDDGGLVIVDGAVQLEEST